MKKISLLLASALALTVSGVELSYKNEFFSVRFDTRGAVIKELIHKKQNWNAFAQNAKAWKYTTI